MKVLVVLANAAYNAEIHFHADIADDSDVKFVNATKFDDVKDQTFKAVIHIGHGSKACYEQFATLIQE